MPVNPPRFGAAIVCLQMAPSAQGDCVTRDFFGLSNPFGERPVWVRSPAWDATVIGCDAESAAAAKAIRLPRLTARRVFGDLLIVLLPIR